MKYVYPAVFNQENDNYNVSVPDLPGCFTFGTSIAEAIEMARDAISMWLCDAENKDEIIPQSSKPQDITTEPNSFVNLIDVDTTEYRRENDNRAIKKTLSIPNWLNAKAEKAGINFSQTLQKALKQELGLE
ncbi:MAG: type II toxin-antitoxin system HicB family antitoxin [Veillonellales bacterium]